MSIERTAGEPGREAAGGTDRPLPGVDRVSVQRTAEPASGTVAEPTGRRQELLTA